MVQPTFITDATGEASLTGIVWADIGNRMAKAVGVHGRTGDRFPVLPAVREADFLSSAKSA